MAAHILIIEDNAVERTALATLLRRAGYRVTVAADGRMALDILAGIVPDLILLDMILPDITGWDLLLARDELSALFYVPILVVTGLTLEREAWGREFGVNGVIRKPFDAGELLGEVRRLAG
jgi:DNA-binding response OmpR family regulator